MAKLWISGLLIIFLAGCNSFYRTDWNSKKMITAEQSILMISTVGRTKNGKLVKARGITISLGNGLYLALTHLSKIPTKVYYRSIFGIVAVNRKIISERYSINGKSVKLVGRVKDISVFRGMVRDKYPFKFGNSDNVEIGNKVWVAGYSFLLDKIVKDGIVASINLRNENSPLLTNSLSDMFEITPPINPGDSGSPVFAEHNGKYEVIAIVDAMRLGSYGMGYAIKINIVKNAIKQILHTEQYMNSGDE